MSSPTSRYQQITSRSDQLAQAAGVVIAVALVASCFGHAKLMLCIAALQAARLAVRFVPLRARLVVACALGLATGHVAHWPLPIWLSLVVLALVTDPFIDRRGLWQLGAMTVTYAALGLYDGAPVAYALGFGAVAWFCVAFIRSRGAGLRQTLVESQAQHAELVRAHRKLKSAVEERDRMEVELRQAQKLEAMGRLAAGVAHEINTPVQFVSDSLLFVKSSLDETIPLIRAYQALRKAASTMATFRNVVQPVIEAEDVADIEYVLANVPGALERSLDGMQRITTIVKSLKEFAHPDSTAMAPIDLNRAIESTLTIASHEYKLVADLALDLAPLPPVTCHAGEINQVVLNIVVNAAHAIEDAVAERGGRGVIHVSTRVIGKDRDATVLVTIADTGAGIPPTVRERIFDPFFTTKEVGRGTGQGLAISKTVVEKHGGKLSFATELGRGTSFSIRLPVVPPPVAATGAYCAVPIDRAA